MIDFIAQHCIAHHQSITTAESCTGGLLAGALTEISGSSQWFQQGWVTYSNEAKERQENLKRKQIIALLKTQQRFTE